MVETIAVPKASLASAANSAQSSVVEQREKGYEYNAATVSEAITSAMWVIAQTDNTGGEFVSIPARDASELAAFCDPDDSDPLRSMLEHYNVW